MDSVFHITRHYTRITRVSGRFAVHNRRYVTSLARARGTRPRHYDTWVASNVDPFNLTVPVVGAVMLHDSSLTGSEYGIVLSSPQ